ncbi:ABC transporter permease [Dehalococcoidia bacterium]|nr:ABC transporter permease [Dehalococcoidia bacterium]
MQRYLIRRFLLFFPTLLGASLVVFGIMRVLPGDVALSILGGEGEEVVSKEQLEILREELGLNEPLPVQYGKWAWSMVNGEFGGESLADKEPIGEMLARRFPVTLQLTALTVGITILIALPLGFIAALFQDRWPDYIIRSATVLGLAMPNFWVSLLVILGLILIFHWTPPVLYRHFWQSPSVNFQMMIWPALVLSWGFSSYLVRVTRAQVLEVLRQDYIRTAYSKGLSEFTVMVRHVLRNALIPIVTLAAGHLDAQLSGSVILENIFGLPGVGQGIVQGATVRDYPVIQSLAMVLVFVALATNLLVDVIYVVIDPRIKYE